MKKITVVIPCYNEEKGIGRVIDGIPTEKLNALGYTTKILVIDNNSTDKTAAIARSKGASVVRERRQGKGYAMVTGFRQVPRNTSIVVMIDGDNTYRSSEMLRMVEPIDTQFCDVVVGTRIGGRIHNGSMTMFNRIGNWFLTFLVRVGYRTNATDVCSGYFAWRRPVLDELTPELESDGFSLEMEMITKMARMGHCVFSVPISYGHRGGTPSKLRPLEDGLSIFSIWAKNLYWRPKERGSKI